MSIIPASVTSIISKVFPVLGTALGGPAGGLVGSLISNALGVDMNDHDEVAKKLDDPECINKLKELEAQLNDLHNARLIANKEKGALRWFRPLLVLLAYLSLFIDIWLILYVHDEMIKQILILFTGVLILDIRQMHKLYFGSNSDLSDGFMFTKFVGNVFNKKK